MGIDLFSSVPSDTTVARTFERDHPVDSDGAFAEVLATVAPRSIPKCRSRSHMESAHDLLGCSSRDGRLVLVNDSIHNTCSDGLPELSTWMRVVEAGGKRLRPALTVTIAGLAEVFDERVVSAATAVELVQVGSLVHDDIFDVAQIRRGIPTINAVEGDSQALLAGTFLLARAAGEAASAGQEVAADVARTVAQLCVGQAVETRHLFDVDQEIDDYLSTITAKTAALFACSCRVGGLCAGLAVEQVVCLGEFGSNFGIAFQIIDDVLDLVGDPALLGKPVGTDMRTGVFTLPVLLELADVRGGDLRALLTRRQPIDLDQASRMTVDSGRIEEAVGVAREYAIAASVAIAAVPSATTSLSQFPTAYVDWALERYSAA